MYLIFNFSIALFSVTALGLDLLSGTCLNRFTVSVMRIDCE